MKKTALVLEGGGMRGIFTAGVLETLMEYDIYFDDVYAVSAGASTAVTYLSRQADRNRRVFIDYVTDPRYKGIKSFLTTGAYFNKKFIFETIPEVLDPFDYETFFARTENLYIPLTNCVTGEVEYISDFKTKQDLKEVLDAATSLPIMSRPVRHDGVYYLDGGVACPLVLDEVMKKGYDQIVYVLTQPKGYRKLQSEHSWLYPIVLRKYPKVIAKLNVRHANYNRIITKIESLEKQQKLIVVRPSDSFKVTRTESDPEKMKQGYDEGLAQGEYLYQKYFK
ncbi:MULTISPECIES: patatin family protein [unclassified Fusibacter]|uniref:patatin-like phospholipase family protein n=1 Tax=unclassified Fusibacter TaxID=2624464 RepID=UPI0010139F5B|nr:MULTISPECIES: patatin family protein [unclassified Fusibacter]MCK8058330.1 patatin family protein [Fusibacter sp. A2]NPE20913.1 patatin family protein [Fusibacter sp. A1]RXV63116.1 patatin family protein [Fusibacter sp. A1]